MASIITTLSPYDAHLRLLFVHGFLGRCDRTFKGFMEPLVAYMKREDQFNNVSIDLHPYNYETKGVYREAPSELVHHLEQLDHDWHHNDKDEQVPNFVIILAHSIGGLVAADAIQMMNGSPVGKHTMVIGLITFDTPFFSLDTTFFELALNDLQRRPSDVVFNLVRARAKPGIRSDVALRSLGKLARLRRPIFSDHFEFFAFMLCGMSAYKSSNMISELLQRHNTATDSGASVPRRADVQYMAELLETMAHRERFIDLINNTHVHFRCYYNKMHTPLIQLPLNNPLFMRFFKPFEWTSDPSTTSGSEAMAIAHTQMFNPRHNKNIDWLVKDVSHLAISMLGRALDNGHQQLQLHVPTPNDQYHHPQFLPAVHAPTTSPSINSNAYLSFLNTPPPPPPATPKPLPARSRTVLRLSTAPVPQPSPTFKSNFTLNRSNALLYRKNRRCSTSSTNTSSTSRSLLTPEDSPILDVFPIVYDQIQSGQHPT